MPKNKKSWVQLDLRGLYPVTFLNAFPDLAHGAKIIPWPGKEFQFYAIVYMVPSDQVILDKLKKLKN